RDRSWVEEVEILHVRNVQGMGTNITDVDGRTPELPPDRDVPLVGPLGGKSWTDSRDVEQAGKLTRGTEGIREAYAGHVLLNEESLGCGPWPPRGSPRQVAGPHLHKTHPTTPT